RLDVYLVGGQDLGCRGLERARPGPTSRGRTPPGLGPTGWATTSRARTGQATTGRPARGTPRTGRARTGRPRTGRARTGRPRTGRARAGRARAGRQPTGASVRRISGYGSPPHGCVYGLPAGSKIGPWRSEFGPVGGAAVELTRRGPAGPQVVQPGADRIAVGMLEPVEDGEGLLPRCPGGLVHLGSAVRVGEMHEDDGLVVLG